HLNSTLRNRKHSFSFIAFHRAPVLLAQLNAQNATVDRVIDQIKSLRPRRRLETSPAKALGMPFCKDRETLICSDLAAEEITTNGDVGAKAIILLAHEGLNTDLIAETLEATAKLSQLKASVFAVTGSEQPNLSSLIGYAGERSHVYTHSDDNAEFLRALDAAVGRCFDNSKQADLPVAAPSFNGLIDSKPVVKETSGASTSNETVKRSCSTNKVDLMIVLDTSGSVFNSFVQERQIAIDLVNAVDPSNATDALRVGVVRFAAEPTVVLSLGSGRSKEEINGLIAQIEFTGKNTRIADAVELALQQLEQGKRTDATQVFVLISDGHGQEFWSKAQAAGKRLQSSGAEIFSVTANADYNLAELALYAGDEHRVYVGPAHATFVPTVASFVRGCLGLDEAKTKIALEPTSTRRRANESSATDAIATEERSNSTNASLVEATTTLVENVNEERSQAVNSSTPSLLDNTSKETASLSVDQKSSDVTVRDQKLDDDAAKILLEKIAKNGTADVEGTSEEDALKAAARKEQMEQFLREQKVTPGPANCDTDLFFLVDRAKSSRFDFGQQLELASDLVEKVLDQDLTAGKVRLSIVAFAEAAHKRLSLTKTSTKHDFRAALADVKPTLKATSLANGIEALLKEIEENRRNESRAIVILITDGRPKNKEDDIKELSTKLLSIPKSEVFAVSLNMVHNIERLQQLTGNKWRVFVDARNITAAGEIGKHAPKSAIERIEHLQAAAKEVQKPSDCDGDPVDLMIVLDVSTSITKEFDEQKQVAVDLLKQTPAEDYPRRVRAGLVTFNQYVEKPVSLNNSLGQSDLLFTLARVEHAGGQTSVVSGVHAALDEISKFHRPEARIVIVIISDGNSRDVWSKVLKAGNSLRMTSADVYAVSLSREYHLEELAAYTGSESRVFDDRRVP
ncbi:von Willebrand factor domain-containing protein, partial [Aphelenchoides avenae]